MRAGLFASGNNSIWSKATQLAVIIIAALPAALWNFSPRGMAATAFGVLATVMVLHRHSWPRRTLPTRTDDVALVARAVTTGALVLGLVASLASQTLVFWHGLGFWGVGFTGLLTVRGVIRQLFDHTSTRRVAILGTGPEARELVGLLLDHPESNLRFVGVVGEPSVARAHQLEEVCLGTIENLDTILAEHRIDAAIVTTTGFRSQAFRNLLEVLSQAGVEPMLSTGVAHLDTARLRLGSVVHEPMVSIDWHQPGRAFTMTKRAIDIAGAAIALTVAAPVLLLVGLAIKLADRGPVLYHSARVGLEGEPFAMVKFRSMRVNAHDERNDLAQRNERSGPLFKLSNDPRVTPVGRFLRETSLDELPQLWNVLRGDMSLVGPRPSLPEEAVAFDSELQARFDIQPGVTGLWQVEARSNPNFSAYRRLDLHYLANRSLALDVKILIATVIGVLVSVILVPARFLTSDASMTSIDLTTDDRVIDLRQRLAMTDRSTELTA